jgi:hypothetical protein
MAGLRDCEVALNGVAGRAFLMDANHDGSVSGTEYVNLETALVNAAR